MYIVYVLQSDTTGRFYVGVTADLEQRIRHHNSGANKSTKGRGPWRVIYQENFQEKANAWIRERQIKSYKGGEAFKKLLSGEIA